jgi:plasmid stabilization system protein ParE
VRLVWTRPASAGRKELREYLAQDDPAAALALDALISERLCLMGGRNESAIKR